MFNNIPAVDFSLFTAPIQKIVDLNVATISKAVEEQQAAAKSLISLSKERSNIALGIKDVEGLVAFSKEQAEIVKASTTELTEKSQSSAKSAEAYFKAVQAIVTESAEAITKKAA